MSIQYSFYAMSYNKKKNKIFIPILILFIFIIDLYSFYYNLYRLYLHFTGVLSILIIYIIISCFINVFIFYFINCNNMKS